MAATIFPHLSQAKHGTADSMGALGKQTLYASNVWIGSAKGFSLTWIALVESV